MEITDSGDCSTSNQTEYYRPGLVMDYYDGNTVTGLWNYAQHFAMSDNSYGTTFGPSTPGRAQPGLRPDPRRHRDVPRRPPWLERAPIIGDPDPALRRLQQGHAR